MLNRTFRSLAVLVCLLGACAASAADKPLKVFILAGQSNMQGQANLSTLPHMNESKDAKALYDKMFTDEGKPRVIDQARIVAFTKQGKAHEDVEKTGPLTAGYGSECQSEEIVGPEFGLGVTLYEKLNQPILIIKTSWGGRSLNTNFRPPSAGPRNLDLPHLAHYTEERKKEVREATGRDYKLMVADVHKVLANLEKYHPAYDKKAGYEIAGFVWFQAWNDMVDSHAYPNRGQPGGYDDYTTVMAHFIRDVRKEFNTPYMPFVIGVMGIGGEKECISERYRNNYYTFREAQAAAADLPEFKGNVIAVHTKQFWPEDVGLADRKVSACKEDATRELNDKRKAEPNNPAYQGGKGDQWKRDRINQLIAGRLTEEDQRLLKIGMSNGGFHYLGSLKCYSQMGEAFAKALLKLQHE